MLLLVPLVVLFVRERDPARLARRRRTTDAVTALREAVLSRRLLSGLPSGPSVEPGTPRAVAMDWHVGSGLATIVAVDDGSVSLYLIPGGGVIGAGTHADVAQAALAFHDAAMRARGAFTKPVTTATHPAPGRDSVTFYLLTNDATLSTGAVAVSAIQHAGHPLEPLGAAGQKLLTMVRRLQ